jgi:hypothetical protein
VEAVKGEPLVLTIEAEGESPMSYMWFKGAQELKYCSENTLRVPLASTLDSGQYCCTVANEYGSVLSDVVVVKVVLQRTPLPPITSYRPGRSRYSSNPDDDEPSDDVLRQCARLVAQQTKNWARLALYLGLLPADAANAQHYQASKEEKAYQLLREWRKRKQGTVYALKTILTQAGVSFDSTTKTSNQKTSSYCAAPTSSSQPASLSISSQPRDVIVVYGQEARLEVRTERTDFSTTFQWYKNDRQLPGKTDKRLIIASTVDSDEGSYKCQISTSEGSVMSHAATIKVVSVAPQLQRPAGGYVTEQRRDARPRVAGMYGLTGRGVDDDNFDDDISKPVRAATPSTAPSTAPSATVPAVSGTLQITEHPQCQVVPHGSPVTLSCRASTSGSSSSEDITYVWYMNGLSLINDTTPDYHIASMTEEDEGMYSCEVSSSTHSLMSRMASISLAV